MPTMGMGGMPGMMSGPMGGMGAPMGGPMMGGMPGMMGMPMAGNGVSMSGCGTGKAAAADAPPGTQAIMKAIDELPPEAAEDPRGFLLRCALPGGIASRLGGGDGSNIKEVEVSTGVRISLPGDAG